VWSGAFEAADQRETSRAVVQVLETLQELLRVDDIRIHTDLVQKLSPPFLAKHRRAENEDSAKLEPAPQLRPY